MQTVKGCRPKSFPPDRLSSFPQSGFFHITTQSLEGGEGWVGGKMNYCVCIGSRIQVGT